MSRLEQQIEGYIAFKRALGFDFTGEAQRLRSYLESTDGEGLSQDSALAWACGGAGHPRSYQIQRYETVRRFSEFAHALDGGVPALQPGLLGKTGDRVVPFIYSKEDIAILMSSARSLKSPDGLRGEGLAFLIGVMSSCGLRVSEALGLKDSDLDEAEGSLTIRESKFGSSRAIALLPDVVDGIRRYQALRDGIARKPKTSQMIVTTGGRPLSQDSAEGMFSEIRWTLLGRGETFAGRMPRLHDARHSFAVATILRWHEEGEDVNALIPYLSAYLGHKKLSETYWYLTGVPELLAVAAEAFHRMGLGADDGQN